MGPKYYDMIPKLIGLREENVGGKSNEMLARKSAKYLKKHYPDSSIICLNGKGHCELTMFEPMEMVKKLDKILA